MCLFFSVYYIASLPQENSIFVDKTPRAEASVVRVIDGDTVLVKINEAEERVRIIGINTPESVDPRRPVECFANEASSKAKELLSDKSIFLENYTDRDKHGRLLAYIEIDGLDFGEIMISEGYAYSYKAFPHDRMIKYNSLEQAAKENKVGLWADGACE